MFTGIVQAVGTLTALESRGGDARLHVNAGGLDLSDVGIGDSIATNGVCLTVADLPGQGFVADVSGDSVNLEVDLLARYLERLMLGDQAGDSPREGVTLELLARSGFLRR